MNAIENKNIQLSPHFSLKELTVTKQPLDNWPKEEKIVTNLRFLAVELLEKIRDHVKRPVIVHSGYRSPAVNAAVGGSSKSQHSKGEAADFHVPGISNYELALWIQDNLNFDQLILENFIQGYPNSGWIHCSYAKSTPLRNQSLTKFRGGSQYFPGLRIK